MRKTNEKKQRGTDQGNAIENETCDVARHEGESRDGDSREGGVTEEESKLAEEYPDGGESAGKKY